MNEKIDPSDNKWPFWNIPTSVPEGWDELDVIVEVVDEFRA